ncbi:helix-turn-helix domain-containing protein [Curvivirga aplysinae]|uniref:helix-turn-helix domain-containing protein n=1 Tax=Curvivirga aplysinae TaxID=2529852 RepID=UPI0012BBA660|nr:helix-turn-helix transcriptional regulator [Curvivirga aplysinae]MTI09092.1 XRE family transcriptional regulator [Curvivirga aplysinae]
MTPFGQKLRDLRKERGVTAKEMAKALQLSPPYLSALEHGHRGKPTTVLIHQICAYFGIIWDDAEELQRLADVSHPKVTIDTSGLSPEATRLANLLSKKVNKLNKEEIDAILKIVESS